MIKIISLFMILSLSATVAIMKLLTIYDVTFWLDIGSSCARVGWVHGCENSLIVGGLELVHIPLFYSDRWVLFSPHYCFIYHRKLWNDVSYKLPCLQCKLPCIFTDSNNKDQPIRLENIMHVSLGFNNPCRQARLKVRWLLTINPRLHYLLGHHAYST